MKKILIALALASTTACATNPLASPAPLAQSAVDEKTLVIALQSFDTALTAIDRLVAAKIIVPGSHNAMELAAAIDRAKLALQAAMAAQKAGSSASYLAAFQNAQQAISDIDVLIKGDM